jgi:hypothetical protein
MIEDRSYGLYPARSGLAALPIISFILPIFPIASRVLSPDPLYEGSNRTAKGYLLHEQEFLITPEQYQHLKRLITNWNHSYNYWTDNCSAWIVKLFKELDKTVDCKYFQARLGSWRIRMPIIPIHFPVLCSVQ